MEPGNLAAQQAFDFLRKLMSEELVLALADFIKPSVVETDVSS